MIRTLILTFPLVFGAVTITGCTSASSVCETICDCEHCNKYARISSCGKMVKAEDRADAYGCSDQHLAVLTCTLEKGKCDEETSNYSTAGSGSCGQQAIGVSCMTNADCPGPNPTCSNSQCIEMVCAGSNNPCANNSDCTGQGEDLCQKERDDLNDCIDKASALN